MQAFGERLMQSIRKKKTPVMVGIDPRIESLPEEVLGNDPASSSIGAAFLKFSQGIIDAVADLVPAVKFQSAFYEAQGMAGLAALDFSLRYAANKGLVVILDAKRGDIGSTADAYADAYLTRRSRDDGPWRADALTVNPFLGKDTLEPFIQRSMKHGTGVFILVRTSNPGSADLQKVTIAGESISERIAGWVEEWSRSSAGSLGYGSIGAVVGATHGEEIAGFRRRMPHVPILLPGYGAQGGQAADLVHAFDSNGLGAVVNNSRGLIFAHQNEKYATLDWKEAVRSATLAMIADLATNTPAGNLRS